MTWRMYLNCRSISNRCHGKNSKNNARAYHDHIRGRQKRELGDRWGAFVGEVVVIKQMGNALDDTPIWILKASRGTVAF